MRSRKMWAAAVLALAATGCSTGGEGGEEPGGSATGSASTSASSTTATTDASEPTDGSSVAPATGQELTTPEVSLRLPAGDAWEEGRGGMSAELNVDARNFFAVHLSPALGDSDDLELVAEVALSTARGTRPAVRRVANRVVDGVEGVVVRGEDEQGYYYQYAGNPGGQVVTITFEFSVRDATRDEWVESVLASVEWK